MHVVRAEPVAEAAARDLDRAQDLVAGLEPTFEGRGRPYLKIWDIDTGVEPFLFKAEHAGKIWSVAYCSGGHQVASGSQDKRVILWNA